MAKNIKRRIVLTGMMGSGKTTIGKLLSEEISFPFYDSDEEIELKLNLKISEIFSKFGESRFRFEEEMVCKDLLKKDKYVISLGGGAILNEKIFNIISEETTSIWLKTDENILTERLKEDKTRPLLNNKDLGKEIEKINNYRKQFYSKSDIIIENNNNDINQIVQNIISEIKS
ncbi:MAG: shikimate kinase [Pseudomonadota bacterium]|nr:shikimate kinase [Pseudomonadota bacterium]MEC9391931.1 shikimate kinase [Pseudomonadota bacterium]MEC9458743.1 shikimate kinase [Pseudomonadota bacterium]